MMRQDILHKLPARSVTIYAETKAGIARTNLQYTNILQQNALIYGISTSAYHVDNINANTGKPLVNQKVHRSSALILKNDSTTEALRSLPLRKMEYGVAHEQYLALPFMAVDLANSSIICGNPSNLVDGEVYEFTFWYVLPADLERCGLDIEVCQYC